MPFCEATSVSSATSHRTAASFHAAAFDPCGLLLWCAVPECSSQCSKLTERWKEAKGVHCNHLHSSIPHPRGPCKVTVFLLPCCRCLRGSHTVGFFLRLDLCTSGRLERGDHCASFAPVSLILFPPPASSSAVCFKSRAGGGGRQGLFVFLFVCLRQTSAASHVRRRRSHTTPSPPLL